MGLVQPFLSRFFSQKHRAGAIALTLSTIPLSTTTLQTDSALAVQFGDGSIHFAGVPRLVSARTTQNQARSWGGRYYFTVEVPDDASEALGKLTIEQREGSHRLGRFELDKTIAFPPGERQTPFTIEATSLDPETGSINVSFNPPIEPGQTIQLGLRPRRTPSSGVYLFGVTAFPAGEQPVGQFLGHGRLHFYDRDRAIIWR